MLESTVMYYFNGKITNFIYEKDNGIAAYKKVF